MKKILTAIAVASAAASLQAGINFEWSNSTTAYDQHGVALPGGPYQETAANLGALVQIWSSTTATTAAPETPGDTLLWNTWMQTDYGDGKFYSYGNVEVLPTSYIYVRIWSVGPTAGYGDGDFVDPNLDLVAPTFGPGASYYDTGPVLVSSLQNPVTTDGTLVIGPIGADGVDSSVSATHTQNMWVAVPEPSTWMLASIGVLAVGLRRRFTKKA